MSGVAGLLLGDGQPGINDILPAMAQEMMHRGPDGVNFWTDQYIGLAHLMFRTTPESLTEKLPLASKDGQLVITSDARIDNRSKLAASLQISDSRLVELSDSAIILEAYESWGTDCVKNLLGDFAFCIWDNRKKILFCARDCFGIKPFYYFHQGKTFAFASGIKSLFCLPNVSRGPNERHIAEYLVPSMEDPASTFYQDIVRLPPGFTLTASLEGNVVLNPACRLERPAAQAVLHSDQEYAERFLQLFSDAIRARQRSAFPVGLLLSGGLDSSAIAGIARQLGPAYPHRQTYDNRLFTYSARYPTFPEVDEGRYVEAVLSMGDLCGQAVQADDISPLVDIGRVLQLQEEPFFAPNYYLPWILNREASKGSVRTMLDGTDGDSTLAHRQDFLSELFLTGRWKTLLAQLSGFSKLYGHSPAQSILSHVLKPLFPYQLRRRWTAVRDGMLVREDFAKRVGLKEQMPELWDREPNSARSASDHHWRQVTRGLISHTLEFANKIGAGLGIEPSHPFCDKPLVEFCLALPPDQKLHNGWTRIIARRAMEGVLPDQVRWRPEKSDLSPVFHSSMLRHEQDLLVRIIFKEPELIASYVDISALRRTYSDYLDKRTNSGGVKLWLVAILWLWLHQLSESRSVEVR